MGAALLLLLAGGAEGAPGSQQWANRLGAPDILDAFGPVLAAQDVRSGRGRQAASRRPPDAPPADAHVSVHFDAQHVRAMRSYYASRARPLPPGLQKKYARTGQLPPGWQKKMQPLPRALERELPPVPAGHGRGVIDGHAVIYNSRTGLIVDVAVLF